MTTDARSELLGEKMCLYSELKPRSAREETIKAAYVFAQTRTSKIPHLMLVSPPEDKARQGNLPRQVSHHGFISFWLSNYLYISISDCSPRLCGNEHLGNHQRNPNPLPLLTCWQGGKVMFMTTLHSKNTPKIEKRLLPVFRGSPD